MGVPQTVHMRAGSIFLGQAATRNHGYGAVHTNANAGQCGHVRESSADALEEGLMRCGNAGHALEFQLDVEDKVVLTQVVHGNGFAIHGLHEYRETNHPDVQKVARVDLVIRDAEVAILKFAPIMVQLPSRWCHSTFSCDAVFDVIYTFCQHDVQGDNVVADIFHANLKKYLHLQNGTRSYAQA